MINNLKRIKEEKSSNSIFENGDSKNQIMSTMTQEIMNNHKKKIQNLEKENRRLLEDNEATNRNFEALSKKYSECQNLLKSLQDELTLLRSKNEKNSFDIKDETIKISQKKIEELNLKLSSLNLQFKSMENKYKNEIDKLRLEKIELIKEKKARETLEKENKNKNEIENLQKIIKELNEKLSKVSLNFESEKKEKKELLRNLNILENEKEKLIQENKLMYESLEKEREKLNEQLKKENELMKQLKNKPQKDIELEKKLVNALELIDSLKNELEIQKATNQFNELNSKSLYDELEKLRNRNKNLTPKYKEISFLIPKRIIIKKPIIYHIFKNGSVELKKKKKDIFILEKQYDFKINKIVREPIKQNEVIISKQIINFSLIQNQIKKYKDLKTFNIIQDLCFEGSKDKIKSEFKNIQLNFKELIINFTENNNNNIIESFGEKEKILENKIEKLSNIIKNQITPIIKAGIKLKEDTKYYKRNQEYEMKKLKDQYEAKLTKKRNKKYTLKNEITELKNTIEDLKKHQIDLTKINKLVENIKEITSRLKLTFESLQMCIICRNCNRLDRKIYCLECGHSVCVNCMHENKNKQCIECKSSYKPDNAYENCSLNNLIARYNYSKLQIDSDLELMITTIQNYLI